MKKLYFLLFFGLRLIGFGQTYTATFSFYGNLCEDKSPLSPLLPLADEYQLQIKSGSILSQTSGKTSTTDTGIMTVVPNMPVRNNYDLMIEYYCGGGDNMLEYYTNTANFNNAHIIECIVNGSASPSYYTGSNVYWIIMEGLKPNNITISNLSTTDVCAGQQIQLACFLKGFPAEVYHWQYSFDNQVTWVDIPNKIIDGLNINNTETIKFSIYDILGNDHLNHLGKIFFRMGYADRAFSTNTIQIDYSACAPVITDVKYQGPNCTGDAVKSIDVYFDRDLVSGESFSLFQLVDFPKVSGGAVRFAQPEIKSLIYDPIEKQYKHSFIIPTSNNTLENNKKYIVDYQAALNGVPKGTMPDARSFTYQDPEPLTFSITPTDPFCHNGEGGLTINVKGGSGKYFYSLDGGTNIPFTVTTIETSTKTNDIITVSRSTSQPITLPVTEAKKSYKIKISDAHGCIEKSL